MQTAEIFEVKELKEGLQREADSLGKEDGSVQVHPPF
jgi:hypothetical protein